MSRIGKLPVKFPKGVTITYSDNSVTVKGPKGQLSQELMPFIGVNITDDQLELTRQNDDNEQKAAHGLYRSLINNMVKGVTEGFKIEQELVGVGYKATNTGQSLELSLGFSHNVVFELPKEVSVVTLTERGKNPKITLESIDKQLLGQVAAKIRSLRKPEPFKGKGIRFVGEQVRRKAGKSSSKK